MIYLTVQDVLIIQADQLANYGGMPGVRDASALESAVMSIQQTFGGEELYPTLKDKASALLYFLAMNHPFVDGNKRVALAAANVFLLMNGYEIQMTNPEATELVLGVAAGTIDRESLNRRLAEHIVQL